MTSTILIIIIIFLILTICIIYFNSNELNNATKIQPSNTLNKYTVIESNPSNIINKVPIDIAQSTIIENKILDIKPIQQANEDNTKTIDDELFYTKFIIKFDEVIDDNVKINDFITVYDTSFYFFRESCVGPEFPISTNRFRFRIHNDKKCDYCTFSLSYPESRLLLQVRFLYNSKTPIIEVEKKQKLSNISLNLKNVIYNSHLSLLDNTISNSNKHYSIDLEMFKLIIDQKFSNHSAIPKTSIIVKYPDIKLATQTDTNNTRVIDCITIQSNITLNPDNSIMQIEKGITIILEPVESMQVKFIESTTNFSTLSDLTPVETDIYKFSDNTTIYFSDIRDKCGKYRINRIKNTEFSTVSFFKEIKNILYTPTNRPEGGQEVTDVDYVNEGIYKNFYKITYSDNIDIYYYKDTDSSLRTLIMKFPNGNTITITKKGKKVIEVIYNPQIETTNN